MPISQYKQTQSVEHTRLKNKQRGITLIELMVAMAVSSVILLGISNIYLSTKKSYVIHDEFARVQENGRFALQILSTNIRNSGFFGCASGQGLGTITNGLQNSNSSAWNFQTGLMGYEATGTDINETKIITPSSQSGDATKWATASGLTSNGNAISVNPDTAISDLAIDGSDILVIRTTDGTGIRIAKDNNAANVFVEDTSTETCSDGSGGKSGICTGDILLVSDCSKSRVFQVTGLAAGGGAGVCDILPCFNLQHAASGTPGNLASETAWNTSAPYSSDSEIVKVVTKTYFVGVDSNNNINEPSLYVRINNGKPTPLIQSIENMQILYGIDTDKDGIANQYVSADNVTDEDSNSETVFDAVVSIKLSLLLRTPNNLPGLSRRTPDYAKLIYDMVSPASPITIDPIATDSTSKDRRMRKVYNLTIKIRNKSFNTAT